MENPLVFVLTLEQSHGHDMSTILGVYRTLDGAMNHADVQQLRWHEETGRIGQYWTTPEDEEFYTIVPVRLL